MGPSPCADAAYVAASAKMEGFVMTSDLFSAALALLSEHIERRENPGSYRAPGFYEDALREACDVINAAAASNSTLIDKAFVISHMPDGLSIADLRSKWKSAESEL
jgi:hypothetical protein